LLAERIAKRGYTGTKRGQLYSHRPGSNLAAGKNDGNSQSHKYAAKHNLQRAVMRHSENGQIYWQFLAGTIAHLKRAKVSEILAKCLRKFAEFVRRTICVELGI
jgi:hypothetical protein